MENPNRSKAIFAVLLALALALSMGDAARGDACDDYMNVVFEREKLSWHDGYL